MDLSKFTSDGKFLMLALDHRGSFKKLINPQDADSVSDETVVSLKSEIINALAGQVSGLLIDEHYGIEACKEACQTKPFLLPLEKSGYVNQAGERITELEYIVGQLKELGASGAKLLIYFNPNLESAKKQLETARKVLEDCKIHDFPFFLEIVTYTPDVHTQSHIGSGTTKAGLVIESVKIFKEVRIVPDVWKLEYPGDLDVCVEITNMVGDTPWILLTGGDSFEVFKENLKVAIKAGAKGFLAGRALWQEVCSLQGEEKQQFLTKTLPERFKVLTEVVMMD